MSTPSAREALARLIELDEQAPTGFEIGTDPQWLADWYQAIHQARQALAQEVAIPGGADPITQRGAMSSLYPLPEVEAGPDHARALARAICLERYPRERSEGWRGCPDICATCRAGAAAVVRLLADQVVPEPRCPILPNVRPFVLGLEQRLATRAEMIAIATELEGANG